MVVFGVCICVQVQNISQSMEVLDLRTYRDLQYVRNTESLMKLVDGKLKVVSENPRSLNSKGFQVIGCLSPLVQWCMSIFVTLLSLCTNQILQCLYVFTDNSQRISIGYYINIRFVHEFNSHTLLESFNQYSACSHVLQILAATPKKRFSVSLTLPFLSHHPLSCFLPFP